VSHTLYVVKMPFAYQAKTTITNNYPSSTQEPTLF